MASKIFEAEECRVPLDSEFPFAREFSDTELIKCDRTTSGYTGTFWCKGNLDDLRVDRKHYLAVAVPGTLEPLPLSAAERNLTGGKVWSFKRQGPGQNSRVYWDFESELCAGELQGSDSDLPKAVAYWRDAILGG